MSGSDSQRCYAFIFHNGNQLSVSYSEEKNHGYAEVASNTILLTLNVGDRVWIETATGKYCYGYPYTAFSGWKI
ncbi:hypothetical protein FSP39_021318 [Pinctada imbricata]|uniref:C1q domain-containing protein n=1 Tax=Pinctada imbricata TaxID=66713 RepID=A0AA89C9E1_PINIB|nr:hypothetical protein FSP39_021318 [Pinctada imbricata]